MRSNALGWAIFVLGLTFTIWNFMAYQRDVLAAPSVFLSDAFMQPRQNRLLPKYLEREVLIVGVAVAAWLVVSRRKTT